MLSLRSNPRSPHRARRVAATAVASALVLASSIAGAQSPESWCRGQGSDRRCSFAATNYPVNGTTQMLPNTVEACLTSRVLGIVAVPRYGQQIQIWFENSCNANISVSLDVPRGGRPDGYATTVRPGETGHLSHFGFRPEDEPPFAVTARFEGQPSPRSPQGGNGSSSGGSPGSGGGTPSGSSGGNGRCPSGRFFQARTGLCVQCPPGSNYQARTEQCLRCGAGRTYDPASETCRDAIDPAVPGAGGVTPPPPPMPPAGGGASGSQVRSPTGAGGEPSDASPPPDPAVERQRREEEARQQREREEEERRRREEEERQRQYEQRRDAAGSRHAEQTARSDANRAGFESTAASMMSGLAGMSVSGDSARYRGASWRFGLSLGLGASVIPAVQTGTSTTDSTRGESRTPPSESNTSMFCPALQASMEFWPLHSPYFGIAGVVEGAAGWYGLSSTSTTMLSGAGGARLLLGSPWIALLGEYLVGYRYGSESSSSFSDYGSSYYFSESSAEASYGFNHFAAGLRLCFSREGEGACGTGMDGWGLWEQVDDRDRVWGARLSLWSTNLGSIRGDVFWDYPRAGSGSSTGLNLWISISKSFDWFGSPYVTPSDPIQEPRQNDPPPVPAPPPAPLRPPPPPDGDGDGIPDATDQCPTVPETVNRYRDEDGCADDPDTDGDGVVNESDRCPDAPEDRDGFDDSDGCPELDNDADGVADSADHCPQVAEDRDGFDDADGCPERDNDVDGVLDPVDRCPTQPGVDRDDGCPTSFRHIEVLADGVRLRPPWRHHRIEPSAQPMLDELVEYLALRTTRGHRYEVVAFAEGRRRSRSANRRSAREARALLEVLVVRGVDPSRLNAVGGGNDQPLSLERSSAARDLNHRVEVRRVR